MAKKSAISSILKVFFLMLGIKFQKPVKRIKRGRSLKYTVASKVLAKTGNKKAAFRKSKGYRRH
jgi:hypothetical protein